jgi:hypothetical protein
MSTSEPRASGEHAPGVRAGQTSGGQGGPSNLGCFALVLLAVLVWFGPAVAMILAGPERGWVAIPVAVVVWFRVGSPSFGELMRDILAVAPVGTQLAYATQAFYYARHPGAGPWKKKPKAGQVSVEKPPRGQGGVEPPP